MRGEGYAVDESGVARCVQRRRTHNRGVRITCCRLLGRLDALIRRSRKRRRMGAGAISLGTIVARAGLHCAQQLECSAVQPLRCARCPAHRHTQRHDLLSIDPTVPGLTTIPHSLSNDLSNFSPPIPPGIHRRHALDGPVVRAACDV